MPSVTDENEWIINPMIFIDTSTAKGYIETMEDGENPSISNEGEALLVEELVKKYVEMGINPGDIGIITPVSIFSTMYWLDDSFLFLTRCIGQRDILTLCTK